MKPTRFQVVKHATAALFALAVVGVFVLGFDGLLRAMGQLTDLLVARQAARSTAAPAAEAPATPGVVPAFVVPPDESAVGKNPDDATD